MYIVDKHKDYYDYLSYIYGVDKKVTFDRRGSEKINDESIASLFRYNRYFIDENFAILEIGNVQYLLRVFNVRFKKIDLMPDKFISCKMEVMYEFHNNVHLYKHPISIRKVDIKTLWGWRKKNKYVLSQNYNDTIEKVSETSIDLPILAGTQITSLIEGEVIWKELQNYISSLNNDEDTSTPTTDVEKAVNHGFDKKTSFRHPIK